MFKEGQVFLQEYKIDEQVYTQFISLFNDTNLLHIDDAYAQSKGYKGKVMHGNILNGFISYFVGECLPIKNVIILKQEIKYHLPVYINDSLVLTATVANFSAAVNAVEFTFSFQNNQGLKIATGKFQLGIM